MTRHTPLRRKTRLNPVSAKRRVQNELYKSSRELYLMCHPTCERCKMAEATDIHHKAGRGIYLCNVTYFMAVCRPCHDWIHANMNQAEKDGHIVRLR